MGLPAIKLEAKQKSSIFIQEKPLRILFIDQAIGGVQQHLVTLARNLNRQNFRIDLICSPDGTLAKEFRDLSLNVNVIPMHRNIDLRDIRTFIDIFRIIKKEKYDIVHTHSSKAGFLGRLCARLRGVPVIIHTPHAFHFAGQENYFKRTFYRFLEKTASRWCDTIIAVSDSERIFGIQNKITSETKIISIPNAIKFEKFNQKIDIIKKRTELNIKPGSPLITMVARLCPQKDPVTFVKMAKKILEQHPDADFLLVGGAPLKEYSLEKQIIEMINQNKLGDKIHILGWRDDVAEILSASDISVLTSLYEGGPYTLLESMAAGLPVVATDSTGTHDVVIHGKTGFLAPKKD
ncbi:MAG: hypothetical protein A2161_08155, partial [Candidatus Schekmanbacteria bacterium RBG_13_48_7]